MVLAPNATVVVKYYDSVGLFCPCNKLGENLKPSMKALNYAWEGGWDLRQTNPNKDTESGQSFGRAKKSV